MWIDLYPIPYMVDNTIEIAVIQIPLKDCTKATHPFSNRVNSPIWASLSPTSYIIFSIPFWKKTVFSPVSRMQPLTPLEKNWKEWLESPTGSFSDYQPLEKHPGNNFPFITHILLIPKLALLCLPTTCSSITSWDLLLHKTTSHSQLLQAQTYNGTVVNFNLTSHI